MKHLPVSASLVWMIVGLTLSGCSGGGGGASNPARPPPPPPDPLRVTFSTSNVAFTADVPWGPKPADVVVSGALAGQGAGTLYIIVQVNNPELFSVTNPTLDSGTATGSVNVVPVLPNSLGSGVHQGTFDIRVCVNDPTCATGQIQGSPKRISVRYEIPSMLDADTVTPRVVEAGKAGTVVLRGHGFTNTSTVKLGALDASAVNFVNSTELRASYASLPAGEHTVAVNGGATPFAGAVTAVSPVPFGAAFLPHVDSPELAWVVSLVYDAPRRALMMSLMRGSPNPGVIERHAYTGGAWSAPTTTVLDSPLQLRMSHDNSQLLALRPYITQAPPAQIIELDPGSLATLRATTVDYYASSFALANDGNLIISTRMPGSGNTEALVFGINRRTSLIVDVVSAFNAGTVATGDGSRVFVVDNHGTTFFYDTARSNWTGNLHSQFGLDSSLSFYEAALANFDGSRFMSYGSVFDQNRESIGAAPGPFAQATMNAAATRLYTFVASTAGNNGYLRTFDLTTPAVGGNFVEVGSPIELQADPGGASTPTPKMTITPDGNTVFIAGVYGIAVQPTPP